MPLKIIGLWITRDLFSIKSRFGWCYKSSVIGKWNAFFRFGGSRQVLLHLTKKETCVGETTARQRANKEVLNLQERVKIVMLKNHNPLAQSIYILAFDQSIFMQWRECLVISFFFGQACIVILSSHLVLEHVAP